MASETADVLTSFQPLALLARFFGFFPLNSVGQLCPSVKYRYDVILTLLNTILLAYCNVQYFILWPKFFVNNIRDTVHNIYFIIYQILSQLFLLYIAFYRRKTLSDFLENVENTQILGANWTPRRQSLKIVAILLLAVIIINCVIYTINIDSFYLAYGAYAGALDNIVTVYTRLSMIYAYNFISSFVIFFNYYFKLQFQTLVDDLEDVTARYDQWDNLPRRLCHVRKRHEQLVTLVEQLDAIMSTALLVYVCAESVSICVNFYEFCLWYLQANSPGRINFMGRAFINVWVRLTPLVVLCVTSNAVQTTAKLGSKNLDKCPLTELTTRAEFQVILLLDQFERRKAEIQAQSIFSINSRLIAKIAGIIITYVLFMIQINSKV